jgi:hypothetical protein
MSLKNSRKVLKNIHARSVIFASFAVTIGAGSARALKNVNAKDFPRKKYLLYKKV